MADATGTPFPTLRNWFSAFAEADGFTGAPSTADTDTRARFADWLEAEGARMAVQRRH